MAYTLSILLHVTILSRLDYCNSFVTALPPSTQSISHGSQSNPVKTSSPVMTLLSLSPTVASRDNHSEILLMTHVGLSYFSHLAYYLPPCSSTTDTMVSVLFFKCVKHFPVSNLYLSLPFAWNFVQRSPYILSKIVLNFRSSLCSLVCFFFTALNATYCFLAYEGLSPTTGIYKLQVIIRSTCSCVAIPCGGLLSAQSRGLQKALPPHPQASRVPSKCCPPRLPGSTEAHCG